MQGNLGEGRERAKDQRFQSLVIQREDLDALWRALQTAGYAIIGPTVRDSAIVYDRLDDSSALPVGWTDEQNGGYYRLKRRHDEMVFGYRVGPHSWKRFLFPPSQVMWCGKRHNSGFEILAERKPPERLAFVGVRPCDLAAILIQDRVLCQGEYKDSGYAARRGEVFIVVVNCTEPGGTCFCDSMKTGPRAANGFDLALTELLEPGRHRFVIDVGSERGAELIKQVPSIPAGDDDRSRCASLFTKAVAEMGRRLDTEGIQRLLYKNNENPRWDDVAKRCLTCGNCTMVCPTCFCSNVEDSTDLTGSTAERRRVWDSCFTLDFSYIHGGSVRSSVKSRYRHWITHKLASWIEQFGMSGCVGCGRCITWCPVGIDITEEISALRAIAADAASKAFAKETADGNA